jgi:hypothetical protein
MGKNKELEELEAASSNGTTNRQRAAMYAKKAEDLTSLGSRVFGGSRDTKEVVATRAVAYATLAVYYRDLPDGDA